MKTIPKFLRRCGTTLLILYIIFNLLKCCLMFFLDGNMFFNSSFISGVPGIDVVSLRPLFKGVRYVGYYTDVLGGHITSIQVSFPYQQAQNALAPTVLDIASPFQDDYLLVLCREKGCESLVAKDHGYSVFRRIPIYDWRIRLQNVQHEYILMRKKESS